jgi:hypothetical protein
MKEKNGKENVYFERNGEGFLEEKFKVFFSISVGNLLKFFDFFPIFQNHDDISWNVPRVETRRISFQEGFSVREFE